MENKFGSNEPTLKDILSEWVKTPGIRKQYTKVQLKEAWSTNMGPMVLKYTKGMTLRKGVLTIQVTSAPLRQELLLNKIKIIDMLNEFLGENLIEDIIVS